MAALRKQTPARSAAGQFALGDGEDSFDESAATVLLAWKVGAHWGTNAVNRPGLFPTLGGDNTQRMQLLTNESVIALGIKLGIGQHAANGSVGWACVTSSGRWAQSFHEA